MLKNIGILFEKRKRVFDKSQDTSSQVKILIRNFLKEKFGDDLKGYSLIIKYNSKENSLVITADSKIIANELTFQLDELSEVLKGGGIRLNRILIR